MVAVPIEKVGILPPVGIVGIITAPVGTAPVDQLVPSSHAVLVVPFHV